MRPRFSHYVNFQLTDTLVSGQLQGYRMVSASMPAVRLFFRAPAVIKFVLRAASILENSMASSKHFLNFPLAGISVLLKGNVVLWQVVKTYFPWINLV